MTDIIYTIKYKVPGFFSRKVTLKNVVGDGIEAELGFRFFKMLDGAMVHVPLYTIVEFSKERELAIATKVKDEAGK